MGRSTRSQCSCGGSSGSHRRDTHTQPTWAHLAQDVNPGTRRRRDTKEIRVTAKKYEYDPAVITVKHGDPVRLVVTAVDHDHGFKIEAFHIDQLVKKGESIAIEFKADLTGTFPFQCSHFCGLGHKRMKGELNVESRALSEVGAFSRGPWLEVRCLLSRVPLTLCQGCALNLLGGVYGSSEFRTCFVAFCQRSKFEPQGFSRFHYNRGPLSRL